MAFLSTSSNGEDGADRFDLDPGETSIGRHPECGIVVDAGAVSRFHAKVIGEADSFHAEDVNSRNGTFLNANACEANSSPCSNVFASGTTSKST